MHHEEQGHHGRHIDWAESVSEAGLCGGEGGAYVRFASVASESIGSASLLTPRSGSNVCSCDAGFGIGPGAIGCNGVGLATPFGTIG